MNLCTNSSQQLLAVHWSRRSDLATQLADSWLAVQAQLDLDNDVKLDMLKTIQQLRASNSALSFSFFLCRGQHFLSSISISTLHDFYTFLVLFEASP